MAYVPLWKKILGREYGRCSTMEENLRQRIWHMFHYGRKSNNL